MKRKTMDVWLVKYQEFDEHFNLVRVGYLSKHTVAKEAYQNAIKLNNLATNRIYSVKYKQIDKDRYDYL